MRKEKSFARSLIQPFVVAALMAIALRHTAVQAFAIPSASMMPALAPGDHILVTPLSFSDERSAPVRGDVVVFRSPMNGEPLVKRVIAVPGDLIEVRGRVLINGRILEEPYLAKGTSSGTITPVLLAPDTYFVMGDSRNDSVDSRAWGTVSRDALMGRARMIFWSDTRLNQRPVARAESQQADRSPQTPSRIQWHRIFRPIH
ncbi:MAG TPA: signal peptidase I [Thermoanaerobaculia bacterium]|nr:signal peptidase I [Thermoanaerobaculia bacterium]